MIKKIILSAILLLLLCLTPINQTNAHELKSKGNTTVLIHINPKDQAIAGQESEILFLISDKNKKFQLENCNCQASVIFGTTTILNQPLAAAKTSYRGIFAPAIPFVFPHPGVYTITLSADPKNEHDFEEFDISYNISVRSTPPQTSTTFKIIYSLIVVLVLSGSIFGFITLINKKKND